MDDNSHSEDVRGTALAGQEFPDCTQYECDLFVDGRAGSGEHNMAVDSAMLKKGLTSDRCAVRIYRWSEPTVSVGYFQKPEVGGLQDSDGGGSEDRAFALLPRVRRVTGGGAILHDQELTYSCVVPATHPIRHDPSGLYRLMHTAIVELLGECGVRCCMRSAGQASLSMGRFPSDESRSAGEARAAEQQSPGQQSTGDEPFLCFLRADPNDIICEVVDEIREVVVQHKIVGSAQRRRRGTILQHGSILISASPLTPQVPGIRQLFPEFAELKFEELLPERLAGAVAGTVERRACATAIFSEKSIFDSTEQRNASKFA